MKETIFKKLPGVLAFKRGHMLSDALMFNQLDSGETPLQVIRHGIHGTQNIVGKTEVEISNVQTTETAKLDPNTSVMLVRFHVAFLPLEDSLNACTSKEDGVATQVRDSITNFLERTKQSTGLEEVARRYARNILNGRWLWRNRTLASEIQINVIQADSESAKKQIASVNALKIPMNDFKNYQPEETKVGEEIADQMRGKSTSSLTVEAKVTLRTPGAEVFPSQNYIEDKPKGFARPLYKVGHPEPMDKTEIRVMGQAAIRDQKVYNAIRTIDTWYPAFADEGIPISIEPNGASLQMQEFYRPKKHSAFDLFKRLNQIDPNSDEGMFCIASFDRGGVYSESDKAEKSKPTEGDE